MESCNDIPYGLDDSFLKKFFLPFFLFPSLLSSLSLLISSNLSCPLFRRRRQSSPLSRFHDLLKKLNRRGERERASKFAICTKCEPVSLKRHRDRVESSISSPLAFRLIFCSANASLGPFLSLSIHLSIYKYIYIYICPIPSLIPWRPTASRIDFYDPTFILPAGATRLRSISIKLITNYRLRRPDRRTGATFN